MNGGERARDARRRHGFEEGSGRGVWMARVLAREDAAQGTLEYAITVFALVSLVAGIAALWRAGEEGLLVDLVEDAASHALSGLGALDIALY